MNMKDFTVGFELDDTGLMTEEAKRALKDAADRVTLEAKTRLENELRDIKETEKNVLARERAEDVARRLAAYKEAGLTEEQAWELVKQEAMMLPYAGRCCV